MEPFRGKASGKRLPGHPPGLDGDVLSGMTHRIAELEAEVERLNKLFCRCDLGWWNCPAHKGIGRGVNPSGDTLGRKERAP